MSAVLLRAIARALAAFLMIGAGAASAQAPAPTAPQPAAPAGNAPTVNTSAPRTSRPIDRIVAVVNDEVITAN